MTNLARDLPPGLLQLANEVRAAALATLEKRRPPTLAPAPPKLVEAAPPHVQRVKIFLTRAVTWTENGERRLGVRTFHIVQLPLEFARRAFDAHAGVDPESSFAEQVRHGGIDSLPYTLPNAVPVDLDEGPRSVAAAGPPIYSSALADPENYRATEKPYVVFASRGPEPPPGTPEDEFGPA